MSAAPCGCGPPCRRSTSGASASTASPLVGEPAEEEASGISEPCGPTTLTRLFARGEAFTVCAFLEPSDVAQLSCVATAVSSECLSGGLWRILFVHRWGCEQGVSHSTEIRVLRSWGEDPWPAPWPLAFGFCGARSPLDHLFWFLPMMRVILRIERPTDALPPVLPLSLTWQAVCRVRAQPQGHTRLARCLLCDIMEVAPFGPAPQHFRQRWARPCASCPYLAHRACLERQLGAAEPGTSCPGGRRSAADRAAAQQPAAASRPPRPSCKSCGKAYDVTSRFPESLSELLLATAREWRWVFRRVFVMCVFLFWLHSLAQHYSLLERINREVVCIMAFVAAMMSISVSQRFHQGVKKIWHTPSRWVFLKLFSGLVILSVLAVLRVLSDFVADSYLLTSLVQAYQGMYVSILGTIALSVISWLYILSASGVVFCFWKTSLRVPTVADAGEGPRGHLKPSSSKCGLCQLGLCLDNTAM